MLKRMVEVRFWFDPVCPWTFVTYNWLHRASLIRDLQIKPKLLSLLFLNEGRPDTGHRKSHAEGLLFERFLAWVRTEHGDDAMKQAYTEIGDALFVAGASSTADLIRSVALELGMSPDLAVGASTDEAWDQVIRKDHDEAMALVGDQVGSPVIAVADGTAFFGPVLASVPEGEDAGKVWDGCLALASHPSFYELKRTRGPGVEISFE
jgi:predicted DsbA family dithiol-disulfide isomerase